MQNAPSTLNIRQQPTSLRRQVTPIQHHCSAKAKETTHRASFYSNQQNYSGGSLSVWRRYNNGSLNCLHRKKELRIKLTAVGN
eukprot:scaffold31604_cov39-Cyclotella_meneghiniana.AAC.2